MVRENESSAHGQVISSGILWVWSTGFPVVLGMAAVASLGISFYEGPWPWLLSTALFVVVAVVTHAYFARFARTVVLYSDMMEITDKRGHVMAVRPDELEHVAISAFSSPELVFLHLRCSGCPDTIAFVAPLRLLPFGVHPVEEQLHAWRTHGSKPKPRVE